MKRILLTEDDNTTRFSLAYLLRHAGYDVSEAPDGETAITLLTNSQFELVITDIIMGMVDGMEVLHFARRQPYRPEVILLTGHGSMETAVLSLREGAFDYLLKPCTSNQLLITVSRALQQQQRDQQLRTAAQMLMVDLYDTLPGSQPAQPGLNPPAPASSADAQQTIPMHIGALVCGGHRGEVMFNGQPIHLTNTEYMLLCYLMRHAGQLCPAADIVYHVHGLDVAETEAQILIKSHIHKLRKKIHPDYFVTVRGKGYRLVVPNEWVAFSSEVACRYGGEEFTLVLPGASLVDTCQRAEEIRVGIQALIVQHQGRTLATVSASLGVAVFPDHHDTAAMLLRAADQALYQAKRSGRNCVVIAGDA